MLKTKTVLFWLWIAFCLVAIVFLFLIKVWDAAKYVSVALFVITLAFYAVYRHFYFKLLKVKYEEELPMYLAELLNNGLITKEQYKHKDPAIIKGYFKDFEDNKRKQLIIFIIVALCVVSLGLGLIFV